MKMTQVLPTPYPKLGRVEKVLVTSPVVICDGGHPALGHPQVYLKITQGQIFCPYCSKLFILDTKRDKSKSG